MLIDRIQRVFNTGRFNALLLEMVAIFVGITASLAVDEWREGRADEAAFERYLEAIHAEAVRAQAYNTQALYQNQQRIVAISQLLSDDLAAIPDEELGVLMNLVTMAVTHVSHNGSFLALQQSDLALPMDETLQRVQSAYFVYDMFVTLQNDFVSDHNEFMTRWLGQWGQLANPAVLTWNRDGETMSLRPRLDLPEYAGTVRAFASGSTAELAASIREFVRRQEVREGLHMELERSLQGADFLISLKGISENIQLIIEDRLPGLRLEIDKIALVGDATPGGWDLAGATPMRPETPGGAWWRGEITLADGMLKIVANDNWNTSWGLEPDWAHIDPLADYTHYVGDPANVFPSGVAYTDGQNIPVRAGRYRVRFNLDTQSYAFEPVTD